MWRFRWILASLATVLTLGIMSVSGSADVYSGVYGSIISTDAMRPDRLKENTTTSFDIVLRPKNESELYHQAADVNDPTKSAFKNYLTAAGVRQNYGQPESVTNEWRKFLRQKHLATHVYDNGLLMNVSGKVKYINRLFRINLNQATYHPNPLQFGKRSPVIPNRLAKMVWTVLGMADHNQAHFFASTDVGLDAQTDNNASKMGDTSRFSKRYQVNQLYQRGLTGKGQTIGVITFGGAKRSDINHFWKHEGARTDNSRYLVRNVKGSLFDSSAVDNQNQEATMDIEYAGSVAPEARVKMYRVKSGVPTIMNLVNAYATALDDNQASALSCSWGLGTNRYYQILNQRRVISPKYLQVLNLILAQAALQGVSNFVASGDNGALNYTVAGVSGSRVLLDRSTDDADPFATSPWVTSVGGTTLPFSSQFKPAGTSLGTVTVNKERSWGTDYDWPVLQAHPSLFAKMPELLPSIGIGGGGGFSHLYATPDYQKGVPGINTFRARQYFSQLNQPIYNQPLLSGTDDGRNYPDVAANADPNTGYMVYQHAKAGDSWISSGGTSIVAPQFAAVTALINSQENSTRMGFWNPQIYQLADQSDSPFTPLNDSDNNSNLYYTGQSNTVYNQASGLGTINFAKLAGSYR